MQHKNFTRLYLLYQDGPRKFECYTRAMTREVTFITGNQSKADYLAKLLDYPIEHTKVELDEIQSLSLKEVVEHKVRQAYDIVKGPVLVEDVALEFAALGRLPGTFIKFFVQEVPYETMCRMLDGHSRKATARCMFGYYDGKKVSYFEGKLEGTIADHPDGDNGFDWDKILVPDGYDVTRALLSDEDYAKTYRQVRPVAELKAFLEDRA